MLQSHASDGSGCVASSRFFPLFASLCPEIEISQIRLRALKHQSTLGTSPVTSTLQRTHLMHSRIFLATAELHQIIPRLPACLLHCRLRVPPNYDIMRPAPLDVLSEAFWRSTIQTSGSYGSHFPLCVSSFSRFVVVVDNASLPFSVFPSIPIRVATRPPYPLRTVPDKPSSWTALQLPL